jgi:predicted ester cyclase
MGAQPRDPIDAVRAMIDAVNRGDFDALDSVVAQNVQRHSAATPGVQVRNLEELKHVLGQDLAAVPDAQQRINLIFGTDSMVGVHVTHSGTTRRCAGQGAELKMRHAGHPYCSADLW